MVHESLLEMHFHHALVELFSNIFGAKFLRLLKPSPQQECWVGFDQGWVNTTLSENEFYAKLKKSLITKEVSEIEESMFLAYFFQFKIVEELTRSSSLKPKDYSIPYFRSEISLTPAPSTGVSQHETLTELQKVKDALVYYACGMLFDTSELYETPVDLNKLRFVPISSAPTGWTTNSRHFITFQTKNDESPLWCSDPIKGESFGILDLLNNENNLRLLSSKELLELIDNTKSTISKIGKENKKSDFLLPVCMTIIEFAI